MREIELRDAKENFSALIDQAVEGEPSIITRQGKPQAVVLSHTEWERLSNAPSFGRLLMSAPANLAEVALRDPSSPRSGDV